MTNQDIIDQAARIIAELQWPTPHSSAHIAQALADAGLLADSLAESVAKVTPCTCSAQRRRADEAEALIDQLNDEHAALERDLDQARATIQRLNRRAQLAEAALHKQLAHPHGAQDPTVNALGERVRELEAERNMALGKVDEYRQRLAQARAERDAARATIQRVRDLHQPDEDNFCWMDGDPFPCPTIRALDQEANE